MSYKKEFAQKVIVVTGASAGLGRALVREFAKYDTKIALLARGVDGLNAAQEEVEALGSQALVIPVDVSNAEQVEQAAQQIEDTLGPIDIWINNAMAAVLSPFKEMNAEDFKRVTEVTYLGQVYGTMAALKRMLPRDRGKIILVGSALAYRGIPLQTSYCGAKHGIQGFFESLRTELVHDKSKVHLGMVQLPAMNTTQFDLVKTHLPKKPRPMGTIYEPEVAARAITYAAAYPKREIFVGYPTWQTILGNKFLPNFLDYYLGKTGYQGQQTDQPADPNRKDYLWEPVPGNHGAHGSFQAQSWDFSPVVWGATHRWITFAGVAAIAVGVGVALADRWAD